MTNKPQALQLATIDLDANDLRALRTLFSDQIRAGRGAWFGFAPEDEDYGNGSLNRVVDAIPGRTARVVVLVLRGGSEFPWHQDSDRQLKRSGTRLMGWEIDHVANVHIPLQTTEQAYFEGEDAKDVLDEVESARTHMAFGEAWLFDGTRPHRIVNDGGEDRIHLLVDTIVTPELRAAAGLEKPKPKPAKKKTLSVKAPSRKSDS